MTAPVREMPGRAADASPMAGRRGVLWLRAFGISAAIGAFLAFVGVGNVSGPFLARLAYMVGVAWVATAMGIGSGLLTTRLGWASPRSLRESLLAGVLMTVPMGLVVWSGDKVLAPRAPPLGYLPTYIAVSAVFSMFMNVLVWGLRRERTVVVTLAPPTPKFLDRLPLKLRGAEVWAVEAEDHYLRLHTSKGQDLILMRLADAVAELEGIEGAQVHRSWWVARDAITAARKGDGRALLTLKDGSQVPASRTYAKVLRDRGWI